ncbi:MAG: DUF2867 domain-containing protein [Chloroflexi bacterium]|nr:DUF2867 domain-containing protein [Chloroflexota bacterium]
MRILVTGATGYIASRLIPQLLDRGHEVCALARHPHQIGPRNWSAQISIFPGDVLNPASLAPALKDVHTAYYLIHNMSLGHGYTRVELRAAQNFAKAAEEAGVKHIIYLGGLADPEQHLAPHMRSRIETGATLRKGSVPVTEFRASVIIGSGSISFEMIRFMTELFPVIPAPAWIKHKSQPIAIQNVIEYLLAALDNPDGQGQVFEIGGPDITTYQNLMSRYATLRGLKRRFLILPYIPAWFMALGIGLTTPVPRRIAQALTRALSSDSVVLHHDALKIFPKTNLIDFETAAKDALSHLHPLRIERVWETGKHKTLKHEGFFIDHRQIEVGIAPEKIFAAIENLMPSTFVVETARANQSLLTRSMQNIPGEAWLEWRTDQDESSTRIIQTCYFAPRGTGGFLYWYFLQPFCKIYLQRLLSSIGTKALRVRA